MFNPNLSPTALKVAKASEIYDKATREAWLAEGTEHEADANKRYTAALKAYEKASAEHKAARINHSDNI